MRNDDSIVKVNFSTLHHDFELSVDRQVDENKSVETNQFSKSPLKYILAVLCAIFSLVIIFIKLSS